MPSHHSILPVVALLIAISGCSDADKRILPPASLLSPALSQQTLDEQVIETALLDIATGSDEDASTLRREQENGKILFSNVCRDSARHLSAVLSDAESEKWKTLSVADRTAAVEAAKFAVTRAESKQLFAPFHPKDPHIVLWEDDQASTQPATPFQHRPIHAAPPGYTDGRRLAVMEFSFPWSIHSGDAIYVLRFDGSKWNVISRHYLYYV